MKAEKENNEQMDADPADSLWNQQHIVVLLSARRTSYAASTERLT